MSEEKVTEEKLFETPDLGLAAYLKMRRMKLKEIGMNNESMRGRFKFVFIDNDSEAKQFKIDFINSESREFDSNVRMLKLMIKTENKG